MYPVIELPDEAAEGLEPSGTKPKFWFRDRASLFKFVIRENQPPTGEDWSEKVSSELCELLGLPHAHYDFAVSRGRKGVLSPDFVPAGARFVPGNELLVRIDRRYPGQQFYHVKEHTLRRVLTIVRLPVVQPPLGWSPFGGVSSASDVFIGYLMLDAWIANQDRHHQNWGIIVTPSRHAHLAPTFDHASSLGWNETDESRTVRLTTKDDRRSMERYVERAFSAFFGSKSSNKPLTPLEAFAEAKRLRPQAAAAWLERLKSIESRDLDDIFDQVPDDRITPVAKTFAQKVLELNRIRLLRVGA